MISKAIKVYSEKYLALSYTHLKNFIEWNGHNFKLKRDNYGLYFQVSYSLQPQEGDGLIFAFLLCCRLMMAEERVPEQGLELLIELWKVVTVDDTAMEVRVQLLVVK